MNIVVESEKNDKEGEDLRSKIVKPRDALFIAFLVIITIVLFIGQKLLVRRQKSEYGMEVPFLTATILMGSSVINFPPYLYYRSKGKLKAKSGMAIVKRYGVYRRGPECFGNIQFS